ncbi:DUF3857 and transglutaminase domain-containing protein [Acidicapsa dinghuensis]|uniref:DUF3857 and transglutaminase domain-containing protein n=1 Tax=Acidicapsa dinghuensis TaxID=2218256 RepID=A0ABW1EB59_9BACT|nr:DUF3857 and transglutaminase domain-containing protein [Acidicapsa dinghuensis]
MKIRLGLAVAVVFAAFAHSLPVLAQFQAPTQEELQMTSEPKAPGASAIYLYREEVDDDTLHFESYYARIKVLTEKGKELATVNIPYSRRNYTITDIKARTIHPDGTIYPLDVKPSDLVEEKSKDFQVNKMVFTLPNVGVGSILEYRWQLRYDDQWDVPPDWDVQGPYFVRKSHYSFKPSRDIESVTDGNGNALGKLLYSSMLPPNEQVNLDKLSRKYTLEVADMPAIPNEDYMPPMNTLKAQVIFYYSAYFNKDEYWQHTGSKWSKEMNAFADESKGLKQAVSQLIAPTDSEEVKARKLYDAVMALDNTDFTREKSKAEMKSEHIKPAKDADDVWTHKSGSSDEIALLYLAMLRIAGIKSYAAVVSNRNRVVFNSYFMSMGQFDDVLVLATIDGKEIALDPGAKFSPFGELDWRHAMTAAMRQSDKGVEFSNTAGIPYKQAVTSRIADITIAKDGSVAGTVRISMAGPAALQWRHRAIRNDEDEVKKQFNEYLKGILPDGVQGDFDHFLALEDYHSQLMGIAKISGSLGTTTGKRVFLPGEFFDSHAKLPFVAEEKREMPVDMQYSEAVVDDVTYHLPDGFTVESAPPDAKIPWASYAALGTKSKVDKSTVVLTRTFIRGFSMLAAKDYPALRDFYQKVAAADQQQLVLEQAAVASAKN